MRLQKAVQTLVVFFASISVCVLLASASSQARYFPDKYDREIRSATKGYWGYFPYWKAWKAQLYQESLLDPLAVSPVGAAGLAQFMPATWAEVSKKLGIEGVNPRDAKHAIHAGAYYMSTLNRGWSSPRPALDRHWLAASSYNAGFGNLLKAQRACGNASLYTDIIECLPEITGRHSAETITYVKRIRQWWEQMEYDR